MDPKRDSQKITPPNQNTLACIQNRTEDASEYTVMNPILDFQLNPIHIPSVPYINQLPSQNKHTAQVDKLLKPPRLVKTKQLLMNSSEPDQVHFLEKFDVFKVKGRDKHGRMVLLIIGKHFPARIVSSEVVKKYLEEKIYPKLDAKPFSMVYVHTDVQRSENFPGISFLRSIYDAIPAKVKDNLEAVYFLHPGIHARLFLATFGRLIFKGGLYWKVKYVSRVEFLWEHVRRKDIEIEIPEFVYDADEEMEYHMVMDYGLESDHPRVLYTATLPSLDPVSMYSMRCIA